MALHCAGNKFYTDCYVSYHQQKQKLCAIIHLNQTLDFSIKTALQARTKK